MTRTINRTRRRKIRRSKKYQRRSRINGGENSINTNTNIVNSNTNTVKNDKNDNNEIESIRNAAVYQYIPKNKVDFIGEGQSKTVIKLKGKQLVMLLSTPEQMKQKHEITSQDQIREYSFSDKLYLHFPQFFPKVYNIDMAKDKDVAKEEINSLNVAEHAANYKPSGIYEYVWVKEFCEAPDYEELCDSYLYTVIQLLIDLMKKELCYIDVKPANIGKRGKNYVIIDTGREDIYFIPEEYQLDYLKGEILIACMSLYSHLEEKHPDNINNRRAFQKIKRIFGFLYTNDTLDKEMFISSLESFIRSNDTYTISNDELANFAINLGSFGRGRLSKKYSCIENKNGEQPCPLVDIYNYQIRIPCKEDICDPNEIASIISRFRDYVKAIRITQFFRNFLEK